MNKAQNYFLCGIGGSGMLPLALILKAAGHHVEGSDRALDQGRTAPKFDYLRAQGVRLHPQNGGGLVSPDQILVTSAAVEETVPDVVAARRLGAKRMTRAELLAALFNDAPRPVGVAGSSGKSTTTAMIAWILHEAGRDPTVMNGAVMKNFAAPDAPFASARVGLSGIFVSEVDESDGSIALFRPRVAALNNIALDHKTMDELRRLFSDFVARAETAVLNLDNEETARLAAAREGAAITYSLSGRNARLFASDIRLAPYGAVFTAHDRERGAEARVTLKMPSRHNVSNALAAVGASLACGVSFEEAASALDSFAGVKRRLEVVGEKNGVTVIDDFAHNPDKIAASLAALHEFPGRLLVMFQPHGYGPLKKMKEEFIRCWAENLCTEDMLVMPEPVYFGGTVDRSVTSRDIAEGVAAAGRRAQALPDRDACKALILREAREDDRIVIMGARDDTLTLFAVELLGEFA
ncbi:MAG: UDP-N-acetylmuramate--L-alanine ligase [Amphiplicatus sp.]